MADNQMVAKKLTFVQAINTEGYQKMINIALQDPKRSQSFVAAITSAVTINPALQKCEPKTILSGALLGESLGLSPSPQLGQYYLVPFEDRSKGVTNAVFQMGYKGYVQLALRSGYYKKLNVFAVKQGELVSWNPVTEELDLNICMDDCAREDLPSIGYVANFEYLNGFTKTIYWSRDKMERHAEKYSKGYKARKGYTFWEKDFDAMAFKTMLRQLISKWGIMSVDMQKAFENDTESAAPEQQQFIQAEEKVDEEDKPLEVEQKPQPVDEEKRKSAKAVSLDDL